MLVPRRQRQVIFALRVTDYSRSLNRRLPNSLGDPPRLGYESPVGGVGIYSLRVDTPRLAAGGLIGGSERRGLVQRWNVFWRVALKKRRRLVTRLT